MHDKDTTPINCQQYDSCTTPHRHTNTEQVRFYKLLSLIEDYTESVAAERENQFISENSSLIGSQSYMVSPKHKHIQVSQTGLSRLEGEGACNNNKYRSHEFRKGYGKGMGSTGEEKVE